MQKKKVFLSFEIDDLGEIKESGLLDAMSNHKFEIYDESVSFESEQAESLKSTIREKIKETDMTLCLIGDNTHKCSWVNWQLVESAKQGKPVVAMALKGISKAHFPKYLDAKNTTVYEWDYNFLGHLLENPEK